MDAVVIGAGVIGLSTAIRLLEAGVTTRVLTADDPAMTTSRLANAMVGPTFGFSGPDVTAWERETIDVLLAAPAPGVHLCRGRFISTIAGFVPPGADALPGFELCEPGELPAGFETGFWAEVPLVDMPPYLADLVRRFERLGGSMERTRVTSMDDVSSLAPLVANCSGLGGSARPSDDTTPDPDEAAAIIARCAAIEPRLRDARVLLHEVGLRPERPTIRLELDARTDTRLVHCYGHGGLGVTVSWGCASEVTALLLG
jgi:D-amino-acid oxidase